MLQKAVMLTYRTMTEEVKHNRACIWLFFMIVAVQKENSPKPTFRMKSVFAPCMQGAYDHYKSHKKEKVQENQGLQTRAVWGGGSVLLGSHVMQSEWRDTTG